MGKITRNLKSLSGALLGLVVLLVILTFILNLTAKRGWGPLAKGAVWTSAHITPGANVVVGTPSTEAAPVNTYSF